MRSLEVVQADVTKLEVDAIANAANTRLLHGGGVAAAVREHPGGGSLERIVFAVHGDEAERAFRAAVE